MFSYCGCKHVLINQRPTTARCQLMLLADERCLCSVDQMGCRPWGNLINEPYQSIIVGVFLSNCAVGGVLLYVLWSIVILDI